jgi:hypothetical protein
VQEVSRVRSLETNSDVTATIKPGFPELQLCVGDREARADRQRGKLVDGVAPGALIRELKLVVDNDRVP